CLLTTSFHRATTQDHWRACLDLSSVYLVNCRCRGWPGYSCTLEMLTNCTQRSLQASIHRFLFDAKCAGNLCNTQSIHYVHLHHQPLLLREGLQSTREMLDDDSFLLLPFLRQK